MESKKRHRRTKAELLQDPEYCKKHGIKLQKAANQVQKKRHRRTKEELLQDPEYCRKHNVAPKDSMVQDNVPAKTRRSRKNGNESVKDVELRYLPKLYEAWEKVQGLMNELDCELNLRVQPKELMHFDFACTRMEQAFENLEEEIKAR